MKPFDLKIPKRIKTKTIGVRIPEPSYRMIERLAEKHKVSLSTVAASLIDNSLNKNPNGRST